ncbi:MAG: putative Flagellar motor protein MotB [Rickettsiales bacterium]|jgi:chemotaxis protein MotB|nr:putative Flagellar motor protein MotB [Rickettsiales bacterium]
MGTKKEQSEPLKIDFMPAEDRKDAWMISFADLLSLMLTFFILIYAMTEVPKTKWSPVKKSLDERFGIKALSASSQVSFGVEKVDVPKALNLDYLYAVLQQKFSHYPDLKNATIQNLGDRILISLPTSVLFEENSAVVLPGAEGFILTIGEIAQLVSNEIAVTGSTDAKSLMTLEYPSNWEFSLARAVAVAEVLKRSGSIADIKAYGLADSQYKYLPEELSKEGKDKLARRVDIVIRESQETHFTPQASTRQPLREVP